MLKPVLTGKASDFLKIVVAAAGRGDLQTVRKLVDENPAWVHTVGSHGRTMLWEAAYRGKKHVVQFLVERGADINACGCHYSQHFVEISPYCIAKSMGREDVADYLLENGAQIDIHSAAYLGEVELVLSFLEADVTLVNSQYPQHIDLVMTPLHYAISGGHREIVERLISYGAEIERETPP
ncbi:ankyrin repeat domain-containing protein [Candidatus Poribacteria bacterium]|nr:ankyrin repeat domain-containing protein [Candidatus Poribacteria bacterium]